MDLIPADILREVAKYLRFEDKLECTLVCRNWYIAITFHGLLYHKLELFEGHNLKNAVTIFKRPGNEELIQAVEELEIYFPCDDINLIAAFSNLKKLTSGFVTYSEFDFTEMDRICDMTAYERSVQKLKRLEYIVEDNLHYPFVMPILKSPHKPVYLKHISYAFYNHAFTQREIQTAAVFNYDAKLRPMIPLLKNAPNLTFLELKRLYITPLDLEEIHDQYAPNLTTLKLTDVFAGFDANVIQMLTKKSFPHTQHTKKITIKRLALKIKSFTLEFDQSMGMQSNMNAKHNSKNLWLKYVATKYPNLTELAINITEIHESYLLKGVFGKLWMSCLSRLTHLTLYDMKFCQLSGPLLKAMDKSNIRLKKLSVYLHEKTIDTQIKGLRESAQRHTVKQLDIYTKGNVTLEGKMGCGILLLLPLFSGLKKLRMFKESLNRREGYEHRIIPHLLSRAPHLEHLLVPFVNISCATEQNLTVPKHNNLKYLELKHFYCDSAEQLREFSQTMNRHVFDKCPQLVKFAADLCPSEDRSTRDPFIWELVFNCNPHLKTVKIMYQIGQSIFHIVLPHGPVLSRWCKQAFCYDKLRPICEPPKDTWHIRIFIPHSILLNKKKVVL